MKKTAIGLGVTISMGLLVAGLVVMTSSAQGQAQEEPSPYEQTKDLFGQGLADALGLEALELDPKAQLRPGEGALANCAAGPGVLLVEVADGVAYCTAGVTADEFEAWDVAERLKGHVPTDAEKAAYQLDLQGEALYYAGDVEGALALWSEAHDLRVAG